MADELIVVEDVGGGEEEPLRDRNRNSRLVFFLLPPLDLSGGMTTARELAAGVIDGWDPSPVEMGCVTNGALEDNSSGSGAWECDGLLLSAW